MHSLVTLLCDAKKKPMCACDKICIYYLTTQKQKSLTKEHASIMVLSLAVNGHLTSMIAGRVAGWSFC